MGTSRIKKAAKVENALGRLTETDETIERTTKIPKPWKPLIARVGMLVKIGNKISGIRSYVQMIWPIPSPALRIHIWLSKNPSPNNELWIGYQATSGKRRDDYRAFRCHRPPIQFHGSHQIITSWESWKHSQGNLQKDATADIWMRMICLWIYLRVLWPWSLWHKKWSYDNTSIGSACSRPVSKRRGRWRSRLLFIKR